MKSLALITFLLISAGGTAAAQSPCPADALIGTVAAADFSCTLGDKTFAAFTLSGEPSDTRVQFGIADAGKLFAVTLNRDGGFFPDGTLTWGYTVTPASPNLILQGTLGVDVSFPNVVTTGTMNGMALSPSALLNGGFASLDFSPGVPSVTVADTAHIIGPGELNSISNDFAQTVISTPEPAPLVLMLAGLGGLAWVWLRRRK
jgi:hypothetical protein